ncbi:MAG: hypothetical protein M1828_002493 [Chrysothrix sp. TS-e1954]|nr:MAG: hypothetical protein M1828_002493 [Chrysothrix sp. TS-e1954]
MPHSAAKKDLPLSELAKPSNTNPSQLGDPISLKAETADSSPTEHDRGAKGGAKEGPRPPLYEPQGGTGPKSSKSQESGMEDAQGKAEQGAGGSGKGGKETLADKAKKNPTAIGDPVSLKSETGEGGRSDDEDRAGERRRGSKL